MTRRRKAIWNEESEEEEPPVRSLSVPTLPAFSFELRLNLGQHRGAFRGERAAIDARRVSSRAIPRIYRFTRKPWATEQPFARIVRGARERTAPRRSTTMVRRRL
jgi:hypothetical protein